MPFDWHPLKLYLHSFLHRCYCLRPQLVRSSNCSSMDWRFRMSVVKVLRRFPCLVVLCVLSILATCAQVQAVTRYFDVNGTTAGSGVVTGTTYDWDGLFWNNNDAAGTTAPTSW